MTKIEALKIQSEIEEIIKRHSLYAKIEQDLRPNLKFITFKEITIKIDDIKEHK
jgi:hypothetical protein